MARISVSQYVTKALGLSARLERAWTDMFTALRETIAPISGMLSGSATYDPPSVAAGGTTTTTLTINGAAVGDFAVAAFGGSLNGMNLTAYVSAANTVTVVLHNPTAGAVDLASSVMRAVVIPRSAVFDNNRGNFGA